MLAKGSDGKPLYNFINGVLDLFEFQDVTFFSTIVFSGLALYMLWCTMKGLFKFGLRIFVFMPIHPMKVNGTWMNSFVFNIWLLLITTLSVIHFCAEAFSTYIRYSTVNIIFGVYLRRMKFFSLFFENKIFVWVLMGWAGITLVYLSIMPKQRKLDVQEKLEELKKRKL